MAPPNSGVHHISNPCIYGDFVSSYAERKSRFMKWLGKLFKSGSNRGGARGGVGGRAHPQLLGEENMVCSAPARSLDDRSRAGKEGEEFDHALPLTRAEDWKRSSGADIDGEQKMKIQQARLRIPLIHLHFLHMTPHNIIPGIVGHKAFDSLFACREVNPLTSWLCGGCQRDIGFGNFLGCMGKYFHPECFRCCSCGYPITEAEVIILPREGSIPTNAAGLIEYRCHPFWSQKYCPSHEHDNTARCCSCERLESWDARYYSLEDGRRLCLECMESAIMDTGDCQPLYHAIRDYYEGMIMKLDQQIPMLLVQRQALNEAIVGEKNGYHHMPETRGLCLSEEQTVASIQKRPKFGGHRLIGMRTEPRKLTRKCEVSAILVLYGLPRLLTGAILAHELMHGWLRLKGYRNLNPEVEEGICQVLSYLWLESELPGSKGMPSTSTSTSAASSSSSSSASSSSSKKGGKSHVEKKLGEFFMHQIAHDATPAYGEGFRAANAAVSKYGLRPTLEHIRLTGNFPL
ncbi:hypothetical protein SADUNF_Sadunf10G0151800 [Salix dunnii]|uniref:LIM zinc-binding domain-containing protein n=1 Tax=Salix dunnii TaxID=1413687 RepID=A0A835MQ13_9ROSI|nr:hypothetical protein SADUNF_Sadunf10G0151800 [Salix dunnii]